MHRGLGRGSRGVGEAQAAEPTRPLMRRPSAQQYAGNGEPTFKVKESNQIMQIQKTRPFAHHPRANFIIAFVVYCKYMAGLDMKYNFSAVAAARRG